MIIFLIVSAQNKASVSQQVQIMTVFQSSGIQYPFSLKTDAAPALSVLQTIPYAQSFLLTLDSHSNTGFFVTMSASSGMSSFQLFSSKFMYLVINYEYNYFHTIIQFLASGSQTVSHIVQVRACFRVTYIIGLSVSSSSTSVQPQRQVNLGRICINNWNVQVQSSLDVVYTRAVLTLIRFNGILEFTGVHVLKYRGNLISNGQVIQNLDAGDYCKTNCRALSGISRFKTNEKQLYFKMNLLSVDKIQVSDIQVSQSFLLVQIYFLNYPEYLRESQTSPTLPSNLNQCFYPYNKIITSCNPCYVQILSGVYQCLRLYEYYSADHLSCQPCLNYCSFCSNPVYCTICTPFSTSNIQQSQCLCDAYYYPHLSRKTCQSCQVLCRTCDSVSCFSCSPNSVLNNGACLCDLKYFLPTGGNSCISCQNNCLKCNNQNSCLCPQLRHYTLPYSSDCSACPDGCQLCSSSTTCRACILQAQIQSGQCRCISRQQVIQRLTCVPCNPECFTCYPDNRCSCSKLGQFIGPQDLCYNCSAKCLSCASTMQCQRCEESWILADGRCFEQCPVHSTFSNKTLSCLCDPPFYSRFDQSSLQCYLDQSLNGWSSERLQALVKTQDSAKNASREISNVMSVLLIVGVATLLGDVIESFAILKLHLFYLLPIHPFLDVVFNVFERILSGDIFSRLVEWLESHFADLQLYPANVRLAGYTRKRIFIVNSATFFLQVLGIMAKQLLLSLLNCLVKNIKIKHNALTRALQQTKGLLSCSKTEQLTLISIQLLSFSLGWTYLLNSLLSLLVFSHILFAELSRKQLNGSKLREQALFTVILNARVILIACFIFFISSIFLQAVPPILLNTLTIIALLAWKTKLRKHYWIRNLVETSSILALQIYLLLGAFYNQKIFYSYAVYAIVAICLVHVVCNTLLMVMRLYRLAARIFKALRRQKTKNMLRHPSKRRLKKYLK